MSITMFTKKTNIVHFIDNLQHKNLRKYYLRIPNILSGKLCEKWPYSKTVLLPHKQEKDEKLFLSMITQIIDSISRVH